MPGVLFLFETLGDGFRHLEQGRHRLIRREPLQVGLNDLIIEGDEPQDGKIRQIPNSRSQPEKFHIILNYLLSAFETGRNYTEKEVNVIIKRFNEDVSGLRRDLIEAGLLARERDGSRYWRPG